jgi:hypothetical protein
MSFETRRRRVLWLLNSRYIYGTLVSSVVEVEAGCIPDYGTMRTGFADMDVAFIAYDCVSD